MTESTYLTDILILLVAAVVAVPIFQRLGLGSVLGYFAAGVVVGPQGFGWIAQIEEIRHIAEFGVIFLLFIIGIELRPARLWDMRRMVFGLGTAQVLVTGLTIMAVALLLGQSFQVAIVIGFGLALSSTAFVLQIISERGELGTSHGRTALSVLLLQDLAVVPLLALVSILATTGPSLMENIEVAILKAVLVIVLVILFGWFLLSPILRLVVASRSAEVFTAAALIAVLGTAWLMEAVGLSLALGAFLAGLIMAESQYRHQVIADIDPFRGILLGLFFMGVGMSLDWGVLGRQGPLVFGLVFGLLLLKFVICWVLCRLLRVNTSEARRVSLLLSQSGEFGLVLFGLATISGLLTEDLFHLLALLIVLTMVTTPFMPRLNEFLSRYLLPNAEIQPDLSTEHLESGKAHIIIAGFGRVGRRVAKILESANLPYLAVDNDPDRVLEGRRDGLSVFYGDASQFDLLKAAGAEQARVLVCTLDKTAPAVEMIKILREHYPNIAIHARGHNWQHCDQLLKAGATIAISETIEASLQLGSAALKTMGIFEERANALIDSFRKEYY